MMQIDPSDLKFHKKLLEKMEWARRARQEILQVEATFQMWSQHLAEEYDLVQGDVVNEDGTIVKAEGG